MAIGVLTFGKTVTDTVGKSIVPLNASGALAAQVAAAGGVHLFSLLGVPVSTSQAIVGAVVGVGLTKGVRTVSAGRVARIVAGWAVFPTLAAILAAIVYRALALLL
jgi:PiT family inorganic phosphate transporter